MIISKEEYINKFLELYDNTNWIYENMLPKLDMLKEENPEEYTKEMLLVKEGYYSNENMRKILEQKLIEEDGLMVKSLYDEAIEYERWMKLQPWLHTKVRVIPISEQKKVILKSNKIKNEV